MSTSNGPVHHALRESLLVAGLRTSYLRAGSGPPLLLLHSGEYGANAELSWELSIDYFAERYSVIAPDWLGFGGSSKVVDFEAGTGRLLTALADVCAALGLHDVPAVATSMGASLALVDASNDQPELPLTALVAICGGGDIASNGDVDALFDYDGSLPAMRRIVRSLFADPSWSDDEGYVLRRHAESQQPGAWECVSAPRFRSPEAKRVPRRPKPKPAYENIRIPILLVAGELDTLKPAGWACDLARQIPGADAVVVSGAGHFPHIERPEPTRRLISDFLSSLPVPNT